MGALLLGAVVAIGVAGCSPTDKGAQPKDTRSTCFVSKTNGYLESTIAQDLRSHLQQNVQKKKLTLKNVDDLAQASNGQCATVITYGSALTKQAVKFAKKNPAIHYAIDGAMQPQSLPEKPQTADQTSLPQNVKPYLIDIEQGGIVAGYIAAGITQTGIVGTVIRDKSGEGAAQGFAQGVSRYNQLHGTGIEVHGADSSQATVSNDINTTVKELVEAKADIIMAVVGQEQASIPGLSGKAEAFTQALDDNKTGIVWVGENGHDNYDKYAGQSLTSLLIDTAPVARALVKAIGDDSFNAEFFHGSIANNVITLADFHDYTAWISDELRKEIESLRSELTDGQAKPLPSPKAKSSQDDTGSNPQSTEGDKTEDDKDKEKSNTEGDDAEKSSAPSPVN